MEIWVALIVQEPLALGQAPEETDGPEEAQVRIARAGVSGHARSQNGGC
jgi:hypothetical protein